MASLMTAEGQANEAVKRLIACDSAESSSAKRHYLSADACREQEMAVEGEKIDDSLYR